MVDCRFLCFEVVTPTLLIKFIDYCLVEFLRISQESTWRRGLCCMRATAPFNNLGIMSLNSCTSVTYNIFETSHLKNLMPALETVVGPTIVACLTLMFPPLDASYHYIWLYIWQPQHIVTHSLHLQIKIIVSLASSNNKYYRYYCILKKSKK